jgi:hypothetical protein
VAFFSAGRTNESVGFLLLPRPDRCVPRSRCPASCERRPIHLNTESPFDVTQNDCATHRGMLAGDLLVWRVKRINHWILAPPSRCACIRKQHRVHNRDRQVLDSPYQSAGFHEAHQHGYDRIQAFFQAQRWRGRGGFAAGAV